MALFLGALLHDLHRAGSLSTATLAIWVIVLVLCLSSIVGSILYTGMHRLLDVFGSITLGITGWVLQRMVMPPVRRRVTNSGCSGTSFMFGKTSDPYAYISSQLLVNQHPPVDDCPCFEDAIAFISVILGIITSFWTPSAWPPSTRDSLPP